MADDVIVAPRVDLRRHCFVCWRDRATIRDATIRVFSGSYGGGYAACAEHEFVAIDRALESIRGPHTERGYTVRAYRLGARPGPPFLFLTATKK